MRGLRTHGNEKRQPSIEEDQLRSKQQEILQGQLKYLDERRNNAIRAALHQRNNNEISVAEYDQQILSAHEEFENASGRAKARSDDETARLVEQLRKAEERQRKAEERVQELHAREKSGRKLGRER